MLSQDKKSESVQRVQTGDEEVSFYYLKEDRKLFEWGIHPTPVRFMITFLPYPDFNRCAKVLDSKRLLNQRHEVNLILEELVFPLHPNQPAVKMWEGYELALLAYQVAICAEILERQYNPGMALEHTMELVGIEQIPETFPDPVWLGDDRLHVSHRNKLYQKQPEYYSRFWSYVPGVEDYWWPNKILN